MLEVLSKRWKIPVKLLETLVQVRPDLGYSYESLVGLCTQHGYPLRSPEEDPNLYALMGIKFFSGMGDKFPVNRSNYFRRAQFPQAQEVWDFYKDHMFDDLELSRLYINGSRVDTTYIKGEGNSLKIGTDENLPTEADENHFFYGSIFVNDTKYNIYKIVVNPRGYVFLWTTHQYTA